MWQVEFQQNAVGRQWHGASWCTGQMLQQRCMEKRAAVTVARGGERCSQPAARRRRPSREVATKWRTHRPRLPPVAAGDGDPRAYRQRRRAPRRRRGGPELDRRAKPSSALRRSDERYVRATQRSHAVACGFERSCAADIVASSHMMHAPRRVSLPPGHRQDVRRHGPFQCVPSSMAHRLCGLGCTARAASPSSSGCLADVGDDPVAVRCRACGRMGDVPHPTCALGAVCASWPRARSATGCTGCSPRSEHVA